jgi:hypothetical protein
MILSSEVGTMKRVLLVCAEKAGKNRRLKSSPDAGKSAKVLLNEQDESSFLM